MNTTDAITAALTDLHLGEIKKALPQLLTQAAQKQPAYPEFLRHCLEIEVTDRRKKSLVTRM